MCDPESEFDGNHGVEPVWQSRATWFQIITWLCNAMLCGDWQLIGAKTKRSSHKYYISDIAKKIGHLLVGLVKLIPVHDHYLDYFTFF